MGLDHQMNGWNMPSGTRAEIAPFLETRETPNTGKDSAYKFGSPRKHRYMKGNDCGTVGVERRTELPDVGQPDFERDLDRRHRSP